MTGEIASIHCLPYLTISVFHRQPFVGDELVLLACLHIPQHNEAQVPRSIRSNATIVMPNSQKLQIP